MSTTLREHTECSHQTCVVVDITFNNNSAESTSINGSTVEVVDNFSTTCLPETALVTCEPHRILTINGVQTEMVQLDRVQLL